MALFPLSPHLEETGKELDELTYSSVTTQFQPILFNTS